MVDISGYQFTGEYHVNTSMAFGLFWKSDDGESKIFNSKSDTSAEILGIWPFESNYSDSILFDDFTELSQWQKLLVGSEVLSEG